MMKRVYEQYFELQGGYFADPNEVIGKCSQAESLLWDQYNLLTPRVVHTPQFDMTAHAGGDGGFGHPLTRADVRAHQHAF